MRFHREHASQHHNGGDGNLQQGATGLGRLPPEQAAAGAYPKSRNIMTGRGTPDLPSHGSPLGGPNSGPNFGDSN